MTLLPAIVLGLLQGATEFLPVSSSGHLFLAQRLLGLTEPTLAFDLLLHLGTLLAVLLFLRREIGEILSGLFRRNRLLPPEGGWGIRDVGLMAMASVPTALIGWIFHDAVETGITVRGVGLRYLVLTAFLLLSHSRLRVKEDPDRIEVWEAFAIGAMQGAAVFPGLSRSGSTIVLALVLGIGPARSAKFSFFLSVPAIAGAALVNALKGVSVLPGPIPSASGFAVSLVVGYLSLFLLERVVVRGKLARFAPYTLLLALLSLFLAFAGR